MADNKEDWELRFSRNIVRLLIFHEKSQNKSK